MCLAIESDCCGHASLSSRGKFDKLHDDQINFKKKTIFYNINLSFVDIIACFTIPSIACLSCSANINSRFDAEENENTIFMNKLKHIAFLKFYFILGTQKK